MGVPTLNFERCFKKGEADSFAGPALKRRVVSV